MVDFRFNLMPYMCSIPFDQTSVPLFQIALDIIIIPFQKYDHPIPVREHNFLMAVELQYEFMR